MKTFESVRSDMAKAWNNAMVWTHCLGLDLNGLLTRRNF